MRGLGWGIPHGQRAEPSPAPALLQVRSQHQPQSSATPAAENRLHSKALRASGAKAPRLNAQFVCWKAEQEA